MLLSMESALTALTIAVGIIVGTGSKKEVVGIDACPDIAVMQDTHPGRDLAAMLFP